MRAKAGLALATAAWLASASFAASGATTPQASQMVLTPSDFPSGATVAARNTSKGFALMPQIPVSSRYNVTLDGAAVGGTRIVTLLSSALVAKNEADASQFISSIAIAIHSKLARDALQQAFKTDFSAAGSKASAGFKRLRSLKTGDGGIDLEFFIKTGGTEILVGIAYVRLGADLGSVVYVSGAPGLTAGQATSLAKSLEAHMKAANGTLPANTAKPAIAGTAQLGQGLTASPGTWTGSAATYGYQWQRCNTSGAACAPIAGATTASYTVMTADEGSTLAVMVTATNSLGAATASSAATALIP